MSFLGKEYKFVSQERFEDFMNAFGNVPEDLIKTMASSKPTLKVTKDGDSYTMVTSAPGDAHKTTSFKSGVEFDDTLNGHPIKSTITVSGNSVTQVQKAKDRVEINIKRDFTDNECVVTLTSSVFDGTAKRLYKAV